MKSIISVLLLYAICSCSQNRQHKVIFYEGLLFQTPGYLYTNQNSTETKTVPGFLTINESHFIFLPDNPSNNKSNTNGLMIPIVAVKNLEILDEMKNDQITFKFSLGETKTIILSSEETHDFINYIKSLQNP